jgi:hypothetical protein
VQQDRLLRGNLEERPDSVEDLVGERIGVLKANILVAHAEVGDEGRLVELELLRQLRRITPAAYQRNELLPELRG